MIEPEHQRLSIQRPCELVGWARASLCYQARPETAESLQLMRLLDEQYTRCPFYGVRRMTAWLRTKGYQANEKRVRRLLRLMGLEAQYPRPQLSQPNLEHRVYPYLLKDVVLDRVNQVWSTDITYIRLAQGFVYLVAIMDWHSRLRFVMGVISHHGCELLRLGIR